MKPCECRCGYRCGGPGQCTLSITDCLNQGHYVHECGHDWNGPVKKVEFGETVSCAKCGDLQMFHDMRTGP